MSYPQRPLLDFDLIGFRSAATVPPEEPVEYALHNCKIACQNIIDKFDRGLEYKGFLTGKDNYREALAVTKPYKGNRKDKPRPVYLKECREYLVYAWGAIVVDGIEADDALATEQYAAKDKSTCIVTNDKDMLYGVPGFMYNYTKDQHFYTTLDSADHFFYTQLLTGDPVDNIQGVPGLGKAKAAKLLAGCKSNRDRYNVCLKEYNRVYPMNGPVVLEEMANLLYIQRKGVTDRWQKPA
jgi:hypothetical protein